MSAFPIRPWRLAAAVAATLILPVALPVVAGAEVSVDSVRTREDGTRSGGYRLSNGMRVVTRHVPGSGAVALTLAYGFGSEQDPAGREGLMMLLGRAHFMGAAGTVPERLNQDLDSARPLGWAVEVTRRVTRFTEIAGKAQFAGALHQLAQRTKGVTISPRVLEAALQETRQQLARTYRDDPAVALYYQVREVAGPGSFESALRYASAEGIAKVTPAELVKLSQERYVPANAVLSISGELELDPVSLGRVLDNEFGKVPAGRPLAVAPRTPLRDTVRIVHRPGLEYAMGTIGIIAPALTDSTHPSFYLHSLMIGSSFSARWPRNASTPSRFQYSLFDDPELARVYPIVTVSDYEVGRMREEYLEAMSELTRSNIKPEEYLRLHGGVRWLLGGTVPRELLQRMATDRGLLLTLNTAAATRELWGGEAFWSEYLRRYDAIERPRLLDWADYFANPENQVQLMYDPTSDRFSSK